MQAQEDWPLAALDALLFESSPDCVKLLDAEGRLLQMNRNGRCAMEIDDFTALRGRFWHELWPAPQQPRVKEAVEQARRGEAPRFAAPCPTAKGTPRCWDVTVCAVRDAQGRMVGLLSVSRDVTELQRAREEQAAVTARLHESSRQALLHAQAADAERARLNALLQAAPVGISYADPSGRLMLGNAANRALWGDYPLSQSVDEYGPWKGWWADGSARHGQRLQPHEWGLARALAGQEVRDDLVEIEPFGAPPGTRKAVLLQACPVRDGQGRITGAVVAQMDITDRVRAQERLRQSEAQLRTITDAMPQMVWSTRPDGFHDYYNQQWYAFTGVPEGSTDGEGWAGMFHPEDQPRAWELWRASLASGQPYEIEYRLRHRSGHYRWVLGRALPVRDEAGRITRWMGTCTDIHEWKLAQDALRRSEESLREADARKDEFLAMLAHELRNPLAPIAAAAELLRRCADQPQRVAQASAIVARQVRHMTEIVDDLLDVSRVTRGLVNLERRTFDFGEAVRAAIEQARPLVQTRQHALSIRLPQAPLWVHADRTRCIQVVANLLTNAAKYTPPGGRIEIDAWCEAAAGSLRLRVRDNGNGIDAALLPHVFELFTQARRTPDRAQGGLGLGLALVRRLMEMHGGTVQAESAGPGRGSSFTLALPLAAAPAEAAPPDTGAHGAAALPRAGLRIALVDDNQDAAQTLAALLQTCGHRVAVFAGAHALLAAAGPAPDVCILDIGLPDMTGHELARRLRARPGYAACRLFALTGYGQERDQEASRQAGFEAHFVKPADPDALLRAIDGAQAADTRSGPAASVPGLKPACPGATLTAEPELEPPDTRAGSKALRQPP